MSITIVHPRIVHNRFADDGGIVVHHAESVWEADAYFYRALQTPVYYRAAATIDSYRRRVAQIAAFAPAGEGSGAPLGLPPDSTVNDVMDALRELLSGGIGEIDDPCRVHFFDHIHYHGVSFGLGGLRGPAIVADSDLSRRLGPISEDGWAEAISSVEFGDLAGVTLLFEQADFRGDRLELWCQVDNLTRVPRHHRTGNWNDRAGSVVCATLNVPRSLVIAQCCAVR